MKLVILYGQEATGKLTVGKHISTQTGFNLFHNHLSVQVAMCLYPYGDPRYDDLVVRVRLLAFESAAKNRLPGLIFTWAYTHPECFHHFQLIQETLATYDVEICLVHLHCSQKALESRVTSEERRELGKISDVEGLHRQQHRKNCVEIPDHNSLVLDTTNIRPEDAAKNVVNHYDLLTTGA